MPNQSAFARELPKQLQLREIELTMKVYMAVNGLGLGHIVRCQVIAKELLRCGSDVLFSTYLDGLEFARRNKLRCVEAPPIFYQVRPDGSIDLKATSARSGFSLGVRRFLRQLIREIENMKRYAPDVVFIDSRLSSLLAARLLGKPVAVLLNQYKIRLLYDNAYPRTGILDRLFLLIARLGWMFFGAIISELWCLGKVIIIPDFPAPLTIARFNLAVPRRHMHKVRFVGPIVDGDFRAALRKGGLSRKYGFRRGKTVIYAAISGPKHERQPLARKIVPLLSSLPRELDIVVSCGDPLGRTEPKRIGRMRVFEWTQNQDSLLKACHLLISRAGHSTILKAMTLGVPTLLIPTPFQTEQVANADTARALGVAVVLEQERLSKESLRATVSMMLHDKALFERAAQIAQETAHFHAAKECGKTIEALATH